MSQPEAKPGLNRFLKIGLPLLISVLAIWLVLRQLDFQSLIDAFKQLSIASIGLIILFFSAGLFLRSLVCWMILGGKISFLDTFWGMNLGYLLNTIIPLRLGEFGRGAFLTERSEGNVGYMEAMASIVAERLLDLLVGFSFLIVSLLLFIQSDALRRIAWVGMLVLVLSLAFIFYASQNRSKVVEWLQARFKRSGFLHDRALPAFDQLLSGFQFFVKPKRFVLVFVLLAVSWSFSMLEYLALQQTILPQSQWWWPMLVIPASAFVNALPAAPGGLGVYEAGAVGSYALVGIDKAPALAMALVVHSVQIIIPAILGVIALVISGQSLEALLGKASQFRQKKERRS